MNERSKRARTEGEKPSPSGLSGLIRGLGDVLGKLQDLAETGASLKREGEVSAPGLKDATGRTKGLHGVYGFTVKVGLGGPDERGSIKVEPFGDLRAAAEGSPVGEGTREPLTDVFPEDDRVVVVAEIPGVEAKDLSLEIRGDVLVIDASSGEKRYRKEVLLARTFAPEEMTFTLTNGVLEVTLKATGGKS